MQKIKEVLSQAANFFTKYFKKYEVRSLGDPIVLMYKNNTNEDKDAILFGFNDYLQDDNFGNKGIEIQNLQVPNPNGYQRVINSSGNKSFSVDKFRVQSSDIPTKYARIDGDAKSGLVLTVHITNPNGKEYTFPIQSHIYLDKNQLQKGIIDINKELTIDGDTYIHFKLRAYSYLVFSFFPRKSNYLGYFDMKKYIKQMDKIGEFYRIFDKDIQIYPKGWLN